MVLRNAMAGSSTLDILLIVAEVVYMLIGVLVLVGNILTVHAIYKFKKLRYMVSNSFIICLSVGDLVMCHGLLLVPMKNHGPGDAATAQASLILITWPSFLSSNISVITLLLIAIDRLLAVTKPMAYKSIMTMSTARVLICLTWLYCLVLTTITVLYFGLKADPVLVGAEQGFVLWMPSVLVKYQTTQTYILVSLTSVLYIIIFIILMYRRHNSFVAHQSNDEDPNTQGNKNRERQSRRVAKVTKMMSLIVVAMLVSWLPFTIFTRVASPSLPAYKYIYGGLHMLLMSNSCMNPVIYCWQNKDFRQAFIIILHINVKKNQVMAMEQTAVSHISG